MSSYCGYEDVLERPGVALSAIGMTADAVDVPIQSLKDNAGTLDTYREAYRRAFWEAEISDEDREFINSRLDPAVMEIAGVRPVKRDHYRFGRYR